MLPVKTLNIGINTTRKNFYKDYFSALSSVLPLINKELEVVSAMAKIYSEISSLDISEEEKELMFLNSSSRKIICKELGIKVHYLNNIVASLKKKNIIISTSFGYKFHPSIVIPVLDSLNVCFTIQING